MNMKKKLTTLVLVGVMSLGFAASTMAAGIGYVNFNALMAAHKNMPKANATMKAATEDATKTFNKQSASMQDDKDKKALAQQLEQKLSAQQKTLLDPIIADIKKQVDAVRKAKGLDAIVDQGFIIAGSENAVDVTNDVGQRIK